MNVYVWEGLGYCGDYYHYGGSATVVSNSLEEAKVYLIKACLEDLSQQDYVTDDLMNEYRIKLTKMLNEDEPRILPVNEEAGTWWEV